VVKLFFMYGLLILALFCYADYRGLSLTSYDEVKNLPKSIRNNPGSYRSMYQRYYHK